VLIALFIRSDRNDDALVLALGAQRAIRVLGQAEHVRGILCKRTSTQSAAKQTNSEMSVATRKVRLQLDAAISYLCEF